ncbi:hypothetical protein [Spartinivicinus poritis]|uniref:Uncharacterized protein n=1 Tax=Spartinivicinus poritis TaxID=2994640 RepID=A0ABT5UHV5_9GAMM|nr:hypothetical protein [Spartinivicinus sp. A2-2]MDE1465102.1 hypothetical protein [Spartinivicinus sp. A2-2]
MNVFSSLIISIIALSHIASTHASTIYAACAWNDDWDWLTNSQDVNVEVSDDHIDINHQRYYNLSSSQYQQLNKQCKDQKGVNYEPKAAIYSFWGSDLFQFNIVDSLQPVTTSIKMTTYTELVKVVCSSKDRNYNVHLTNPHSEQVTVYGSWVKLDNVDYFRTTSAMYHQVNAACQNQYGSGYAALPEKANGNISHRFLISRNENWPYTSAELRFYDFNTSQDSHSDRNPNFKYYVQPRFTNMTTFVWDEATVVCRPENQRIDDHDWSYIRNLQAYPYQPETMTGNWVQIEDVDYLSVSNTTYQHYKRLCQSLYSTYVPLVIKDGNPDNAYNLLVTQ